MSESPDRPLRRRIALAVGAGALAIAGGAGVAYAATIDEPVETGWATVVEPSEAAAADGDCPDQGSEGGTGDAAPQDGAL